ncbi:hypothetical protein D917_08013 [Trichinella nativa]|uniref:Uncharacterized protein n=1 Tax=Trichinella nativa TaxID=6335 RepID=A0A1Y3ELT4_9BILA|nr:hypothetical protein D917_08013 [Trichinella nativa]
MLGAFSRVCLRNTIFCEEWRVQVSAIACLIQASNAGALFVYTVLTTQQCCLQVHTHSTLPSCFKQQLYYKSNVAIKMSLKPIIMLYINAYL